MKTETGLNHRVVSAVERYYKHAKKKQPYFILLRVIDVLDGRQALGMPKEGGAK